MYEIINYETSCGNIPFRDFLLTFDKGDYKKLATIELYVKMLKEYGPEINNKFRREAVKKLKDDIYELRPGDSRILFFYYINNKIVILHAFKKKTRKTPKYEIEKAITEAKDYKERNK